jgi:hypothetical protein
MEVINLVCCGGLGIALIVVLILIALSIKPVQYKKKIEGPNTCITIIAKRNIDKVTVKTTVYGDEMNFERKRIRKGQHVDFVFPTPEKKIKLIVEVESGNQRVFEV